MSKVLVTSGHLQDIADAIREKNGGSALYRPGDMAAAVRALVGAGYPEPTGSVEITENGTYDVKDAAEAVVNVSGSGAALELNFDFRQSMTDTVQGYTPDCTGITQGASGAVFTSELGRIRLDRRRYSANTFTYEVDVDTLNLNPSGHKRFLMGSDSYGFVYRSSGVWSFYNGSWVESGITSRTEFNGCTIKIYVDASGYWHIYKNGTLWWEPSNALSLDQNNSTDIRFRIGSVNNQSIGSGSVITGFRVY